MRPKLQLIFSVSNLTQKPNPVKSNQTAANNAVVWIPMWYWNMFSIFLFSILIESPYHFMQTIHIVKCPLHKSFVFFFCTGELFSSILTKSYCPEKLRIMYCMKCIRRWSTHFHSRNGTRSRSKMGGFFPETKRKVSMQTNGIFHAWNHWT